MKALLRRLSRYAAVSAISTSVTLSLLGVLVYTNALSPGWANVVATAAGTVPSFELNRRWVWAKKTKRSLMKEVRTVLRPVVHRPRALDAGGQAGRRLGGRSGAQLRCGGPRVPGRQPSDLRLALGGPVLPARPGACSPSGPAGAPVPSAAEPEAPRLSGADRTARAGGFGEDRGPSGAAMLHRSFLNRRPRARRWPARRLEERGLKAAASVAGCGSTGPERPEGVHGGHNRRP